MAPGKHWIGIELDYIVGRRSRLSIQAEFEKDRRYRVTSERLSNLFVVSLRDETVEETDKSAGAKVLQTHEVPVMRPIAVPIVVPIVR